MTFKVGDFVCVPPYGGIPMKVMAIDGDQVECFWMDAKRKPHNKKFKAELLKPFKRAKPITFRF